MKYRMVIMDNCPKCSDSKKKLEEAGLLNEVELVNISSQEGRDLAVNFKLRNAGCDILDTEANTKLTVEEFMNMKK